MIEKQMASMLERNWGLKRFNSVEEEFDPEKHQAIAMEETDKYETSVVLEDYQKGYILHDRVLRPSKVKVSKPISPENTGKKINDSEEDKE
jgi:molecular chaperone GrpE